MIRDITIGQYYPVESVVHRLDPRTKLFGTLIYIISLFFADNLLCYAAATVFLAMAVGLATGMGYVGLAVMAFVIVAAMMLLLTAVNFGGADEHERVLKITIPESLDYDGLFDDLFEKYTKSCVLERVKTSNMGTLYELTYRVTLPDDHAPKAFLDELRCRNGNLNIICGREATKDAL